MNSIELNLKLKFERLCKSLGKRQNFQIHYEYNNTTEDKIELWFSEPKESNTQQNISIERNIEPKKITKYPFLNNIWYFELQPEEKLEVVIKYYGSSRDKNYIDTISTEERNFFLRSTELIPVNEQLQKEAKAIVGEAKTDMDKGKRLYEYIVKNYRYSTKFSKRGVFHFLQSKKGDCGEFGALYCSYCRALGIPARMLYATWALKKFSPHAWSEIYIDGKGWIPVDPSTGRLKLYFHPLYNLSTSIYYGTFQNKNKYFGDHEGKRFAFSIEPERLLNPAYHDAKEYPDTLIKECFANKEIAWGYESINGKAPFLQPIYSRIHSKVKKIPYKLLFGDWKGKHLQPSKNLTYKTKITSFNIGFIIVFMGLINEYMIQNEWLFNLLPLIYTSLILLGTVLSLIRKEGNTFIYILGVLFLFNFIGMLTT